MQHILYDLCLRIIIILMHEIALWRPWKVKQKAIILRSSAGAQSCQNILNDPWLLFYPSSTWIFRILLLAEAPFSHGRKYRQKLSELDSHTIPSQFK